MEEQPVRTELAGEFPVKPEVAVVLIAQDRKVTLGALMAQLVGPPRMRLEFDDGKGRGTGNQTHDPHRRLGGLAASTRGIPRADALGSTAHVDPVAPDRAAFAWMAEDNCDVAFHDATLHERFSHRSRRLGARCD